MVAALALAEWADVADASVTSRVVGGGVAAVVAVRRRIGGHRPLVGFQRPLTAPTPAADESPQTVAEGLSARVRMADVGEEPVGAQESGARRGIRTAGFTGGARHGLEAVRFQTGRQGPMWRRSKWAHSSVHIR